MSRDPRAPRTSCVRKPILVLLVLGALACSDDAAPRPPLGGQLVRRGGASVAGAVIHVSDSAAQVGANGRFVLEGVPAGAHLAMVQIAGERPHAVPVFVPEEGSS